MMPQKSNVSLPEDPVLPKIECEVAKFSHFKAFENGTEKEGAAIGIFFSRGSEKLFHVLQESNPPVPLH
jgi:hypothetical protein